MTTSRPAPAAMDNPRLYDLDDYYIELMLDQMPPACPFCGRDHIEPGLTNKHLCGTCQEPAPSELHGNLPATCHIRKRNRILKVFRKR